MLARIGWYLLFLIAYGIYSLLVSYGQQRQKQLLTAKKGSAFLANQLGIIGGLIPIVLIPWILTGFFSKVFLFALLGAFELSSLLVYLSYTVTNITPRHVALRFTLWAAELTIKHPFIVTITMIVFGLVVLGGYVITTTYIYFANPPGSQHAVRGILSVSMFLYLAGAIFVGASSIAQISSPLVNNSIRRALFFGQAANALPMGIILSVYLFLMGIGTEQLLPQSVKLHPEFFPQYIPLIVLILFYLIILIVPYFIGLEGRRRREIAIYRSNLNRITRIIDVVGVPSPQDVNQLTDLRQEFKKEVDDLKVNEPIIQIAEESSSAADKDENMQVIYEAYKAFKDQDPRLINLSAMQELDKNLEEMIGEYNRLASQPNQTQLSIELSRSLEGHFIHQQQHYENKIKAAEEMKVLTPVLARLIAVLGAAPVVLQYGQRLIKLLPINQ